MRHLPQLAINPAAIGSRLRELASVHLCDCCALPIVNAITDMRQLIVEVEWLYIELVKERMRSANLEAAIRAALNAYDDGESDPLSYLRDEISEYLKDTKNNTARGWK